MSKPYICKKCGKEMWSLNEVVEYWDDIYCRRCNPDAQIDKQQGITNERIKPQKKEEANDKKIKEISPTKDNFYKKGDFIGQKYEVYDILGMGGFGIVYLVYLHETKSAYALKTFRNEYLEDVTTRERFKKEAQVWIDLVRHPYLVRASFVDEISGRLYIAMEHIASDEPGMNTLDGFLRRRPPDLAQSLRWAIQFCHGMEYACSKGVKAHRDIKPANIMIDQNKTVKITDFGLARVLVESSVSEQGRVAGKVGIDALMQTVIGKSIGTPEYMSPEQFTDLSACDERSDIYSFGIVLYQMASGGRLPFNTDNPALRWPALKHFHQETPVPELNSPLFPIIQRCLEKEPRNRYQTFGELRTDIELVLKRQTGQTIKLPEQQELDWWEWGNKGISLHRLGFFDNAIQCYNKALEINMNDNISWNYKGIIMRVLGHFDDALVCFENALKINPSDAGALTNKGICLDSLGFFKNANRCFDDALKIDTRFGPAWVSKGCSLNNLGRSEESIHCYDRAIEIEPTNTNAWYNKGMIFNKSGRFNDAVNCFNEVLKINPLHAGSWYEKGLSFASLELYEKELFCFNKLLEIDPKYSAAWYLKANVEEMLGKNEDAISSYKHFIALPATQDKSKVEHAEQRLLELRKAELNALIEKGDSLYSNGYFEEAIKYYEKALIIDQHESYAWYKKGIAFYKLGDYVKAIECYKNASGITPGNPSLWYNKALAEDELGLKDNAMHSFKKVIELAPAQYTEQIDYARRRIKELRNHL